MVNEERIAAIIQYFENKISSPEKTREKLLAIVNTSDLPDFELFEKKYQAAKEVIASGQKEKIRDAVNEVIFAYNKLMTIGLRNYFNQHPEQQPPKWMLLSSDESPIQLKAKKLLDYLVDHVCNFKHHDQKKFNDELKEKNIDLILNDQEMFSPLFSKDFHRSHPIFGGPFNDDIKERDDTAAHAVLEKAILAQIPQLKIEQSDDSIVQDKKNMMLANLKVFISVFFTQAGFPTFFPEFEKNYIRQGNRITSFVEGKGQHLDDFKYDAEKKQIIFRYRANVDSYSLDDAPEEKNACELVHYGEVVLHFDPEEEAPHLVIEQLTALETFISTDRSLEFKYESAEESFKNVLAHPEKINFEEDFDGNKKAAFENLLLRSGGDNSYKKYALLEEKSKVPKFDRHADALAFFPYLLVKDNNSKVFQKIFRDLPPYSQVSTLINIVRESEYYLDQDIRTFLLKQVSGIEKEDSMKAAVVIALLEKSAKNEQYIPLLNEFLEKNPNIVSHVRKHSSLIETLIGYTHAGKKLYQIKNVVGFLTEDQKKQLRDNIDEQDHFAMRNKEFLQVEFEKINSLNQEFYQLPRPDTLKKDLLKLLHVRKVPEELRELLSAYKNAYENVLRNAAYDKKSNVNLEEHYIKLRDLVNEAKFAKGKLYARGINHYQKNHSKKILNGVYAFNDKNVIVDMKNWIKSKLAKINGNNFDNRTYNEGLNAWDDKLSDDYMTETYQKDLQRDSTIIRGSGKTDIKKNLEQYIDEHILVSSHLKDKTQFKNKLKALVNIVCQQAISITLEKSRSPLLQIDGKNRTFNFNTHGLIDFYYDEKAKELVVRCLANSTEHQDIAEEKLYPVQHNHYVEIVFHVDPNEAHPVILLNRIHEDQSVVSSNHQYKIANFNDMFKNPKNYTLMDEEFSNIMMNIGESSDYQNYVEYDAKYKNALRRFFENIGLIAKKQPPATLSNEAHAYHLAKNPLLLMQAPYQKVFKELPPELAIQIIKKTAEDLEVYTKIKNLFAQYAKEKFTDAQKNQFVAFLLKKSINDGQYFFELDHFLEAFPDFSVDKVLMDVLKEFAKEEKYYQQIPAVIKLLKDEQVQELRNAMKIGSPTYTANETFLQALVQPKAVSAQVVKQAPSPSREAINQHVAPSAEEDEGESTHHEPPHQH